jgi:hypothetical protein
LKEQLVELEEKLEAGDSSPKSQHSPADWETQQRDLQSEIDRLQTELHDTASNLEQQVQSIRQELSNAQRERDSAFQSSEEIHRRLEMSRHDLEELQQENALLERRAQDAEHKVGTLLDQVELSVDNYRRRSRQAPSLNTESIGLASASPTNGGGGGNGNGNGNGNHRHIQGHMRQESTASEAESLYGTADDSTPTATPVPTHPSNISALDNSSSPAGNARNSAALDSLANELETLRTHWEATNKNYRLSNTFDFDMNPAVQQAAAAANAKKEEGSGTSGLGLSESLADWRKRLDEGQSDGPRGK